MAQRVCVDIVQLRRGSTPLARRGTCRRRIICDVWVMNDQSDERRCRLDKASAEESEEVSDDELDDESLENHPKKNDLKKSNQLNVSQQDDK
ncbi:hypothetical protein Tco_0565408 [Tanacetum coccineum]